MAYAEFDIFLSHNSTDKSDVVKLATKLKEFGLNPWLDAWHLEAGEKWLPAIERALGNSNSCAVIVGPNGLGNVHEDEMWVALQQALESKARKRRFPVIPVLLPNSTRGDRMRLPKFLTSNTWVEFQRSIDDPAALDKLAKAIRGEAPGAGVALTSGECPYRGLAYFDVRHAPLFFGREALTDWLLSRLRGTATKGGPTRFLAIVGASGSGKSSLARAGVLAKLKGSELAGSENWPHVICRPESRPLESLATALAGLEGELGPIAKSEMIAGLIRSLQESSEKLHLVAQAALPANDPDWRLVVFVDQFEELFTLNVSGQRNSQSTPSSPGLSADRVAFIRNLLHAARIDDGRTIVILTMRADFYGKCAAFPDLADAVSAYQQLVGPMSADELRRAIETPAQLSGSDVEAGLVDLLVREVTDQPGALPLLQYALAELWQKSRDMGCSKLMTSAYRDLGGWKGALSRRADAVFAGFKNTPQEKLCRELFLRLVQPGEGTEDTKRLVRWQELRRGNVEDTAALEQTVRKLADNRLITTSGESMAGEDLSPNSTVEVVHEALIRGWGELRSWLDADRAGLRIHRRLTESAEEWIKTHPDPTLRDSTLFYDGTRLALTKEWADKHSDAFSDLEREFLDASIQQAETKRQTEELRRQRELENARRLTFEAQRREHEQTQAATRLRRLAGVLLIATMIAIVLGITAFIFYETAVDRSELADKARSAEMTAKNVALENLKNAQRYLYIDYIQSAQRALEEHDLDRLQELLAGTGAWDPKTGSSQWQALRGWEWYYLKSIADPAQKSNVSIVLTGLKAPIAAMAWSQNGEKLALVGSDGILSLWSGSIDGDLVMLEPEIGPLTAVSWSPDSLLVACAGPSDDRVKVFDVSARHELFAIQGHTAVAWSPDGKLLITAGNHLDEGTKTGDKEVVATYPIRVYDVASRHEISWERVPKAIVYPMAFGSISALFWSPDGDRIAVVEADGRGREYKVHSDLPGESLIGVACGSPLTWNSTGTKTAYASRDGIVISNGEERVIARGHRAEIRAISWSSDEKRLASVDANGIVKVFDTITGQELLSLRGHTAIAWDRFGRRLAAGGEGNIVQVWDASSSYEQH